MMDLLITNKKQNFVKSVVIDLELSDRSLIFAIRTHCTLTSRPKVSYARNFKNFIATDLLHDLSQIG